MSKQNQDNILFIHSRCCNAHWEMLHDNDKELYGLYCEKCGKVGIFFKKTNIDKLDVIDINKGMEDYLQKMRDDEIDKDWESHIIN